MTPKEFTDALGALDWKQADFCRMADVGRNTVSRWVNGATPVPGWAERFLAMAMEIKRVARLIDPSIR